MKTTTNGPIFKKEQVQNPIITPHGETIFELIGLAPQSGGVQAHSLAHIVISPGAASVPHHHGHTEESYYILRGTARLIIDSKKYGLHPGEACLIKTNQVHQIINTGSSDLEFLAICAPAWTPEDSL